MSEQGTAGFSILVVAFSDEATADEALEAMKQAKKEKQIYFEDVAIIKKDPVGRLSIKETGDVSAGKGAGIGAVVGGVIGLIAGPESPPNTVPSVGRRRSRSIAMPGTVLDTVTASAPASPIASTTGRTSATLGVILTSRPRATRSLCRVR